MQMQMQMRMQMHQRSNECVPVPVPVPDSKKLDPIKYKKKPIPGALRQATWLAYNGPNTFLAKCHVAWCENTITPFSFQVGHNIPESKGGSHDINNLRPICANCNGSMSANFTIDEFSALSTKRTEKQDVIVIKKRSLFTQCFH